MNKSIVKSLLNIDLPSELKYPIHYSAAVEELVYMYGHANMFFIHGLMCEEIDAYEHDFIHGIYTLEQCDFWRDKFEDVNGIGDYVTVALGDKDGKFYFMYDWEDNCIYYTDDIGYD